MLKKAHSSQFTAAFAIGYDWFYDAWTDAQKSTIRTAILELGLQYGYNAYANSTGAGANYAWWTKVNGNWNCAFCFQHEQAPSLTLFDCRRLQQRPHPRRARYHERRHDWNGQGGPLVHRSQRGRELRLLALAGRNLERDGELLVRPLEPLLWAEADFSGLHEGTSERLDTRRWPPRS